MTARRPGVQGAPLPLHQLGVGAAGSAQPVVGADLAGPAGAEDREAEAPMRQAHQRLATALGGKLVSWPGADHNAQLTHPGEVLEVPRRRPPGQGEFSLAVRG